MPYLVLSLLAFGVGPLLLLLANRIRSATVFVDAFVLVVVAGLVGTHVLPESIQLGGWAAVGAAVVGCVIPVLAERGMRPDPNSVVGRGRRGFIVFLALSGMFVHAMIDGAALAGVELGLSHDHAVGEHEHSHGDGQVHIGAKGQVSIAVVWAVIAHRIPVGIGIWSIVGRTLGTSIALTTLIVTMAGTVVGFLFGGTFFTESSRTAAGVFQALLCGSLLHVLLHAHVPAPKNVSVRARNAVSACGALAAIAAVYAIESGHDHGVGGMTSGGVFMALALESAPILIVAYLVAGLAHVFTPSSWLQHINRGSSFRQALRGIAVGLPLPVCSCGVVPIYRGLVMRGAAVAAAIGFLIATPELEVAAVLITFELMGPEIGIARLVAAALLALIVGMVIGMVAKRREAASDAALPFDDLSELSTRARMRVALRTGFVDMVDQTAPWILLGLTLSALLMPYVSPETFAAMPAGLDVVLAAALGMPLYVCASGSTPLAAVFVATGLSPGAAIAFLLTGPATNVTTVGVIKDLHGGRVASVFVVAMVVIAILLGLAVNGLIPSVAVPAGAALGHEHSASPLQWAGLVAFAALVVASLFRRGTRTFLGSLFSAPSRTSSAAGEDCCH